MAEPVRRPDVNFDRVAAAYDVTRGGDARATAYAHDLAAHLPPGDVLDIGVGTGIVAAALLAEAPHVGRLVGIDISTDMLAQARERLPGTVVRASALRLPFGAGRFDAAVAVHVLHLVPDLDATLLEAARVLRPGGVLVAIHGELNQPDDDLMVVTRPLRTLIGTRQDTPEAVAAAASRAGFRCVEQRASSPLHANHTPAGLADLIAARMWSYLWTVDDVTWTARVEPVIAALRALPDPDRPRPQSAHMIVTVLALTS
jgi:ubiquinone/menaquinone biosynthesis C-methylase UbiE